MSKDFNSLPGGKVYSALMDAESILLAANPRFNLGILEGIFQASKDLDTIVIFELARSECDLKGGYTGLTPETFANNVRSTAKKIDYPYFVIHGDHIKVQKNTEEVIKSTKKLIKNQIENGYTSFAIDASFLFNIEAETTYEQLEDNIKATTELAHFIKDNVAIDDYGLEVEVGEIGKMDENGLVYTTVDEAVTFIKALNENDVHPNFLAIANGSTHGNIYNDKGEPIEQITIDIPRTKEIAKAIEKFGVRIAQHGITGTPLDLIEEHFPKGLIGKGNVGTYWQNIVWDVLKTNEVEIFSKIKDWVLEKYRPTHPK
ncbi:MAG: class II fructose-bisphosphate aldolase, partial [Candidatus Lokiarchaeota archaeon]|nr:class II fructose-bisphosphate aldolase [Candidatus Lokiarchaeota archaeon]